MRRCTGKERRKSRDKTQSERRNGKRRSMYVQMTCLVSFRINLGNQDKHFFFVFTAIGNPTQTNLVSIGVLKVVTTVGRIISSPLHQQKTWVKKVFWGKNCHSCVFLFFQNLNNWLFIPPKKIPRNKTEVMQFCLNAILDLFYLASHYRIKQNELYI